MTKALTSRDRDENILNFKIMTKTSETICNSLFSVNFSEIF